MNFRLSVFSDKMLSRKGDDKLFHAQGCIQSFAFFGIYVGAGGHPQIHLLLPPGPRFKS